MTSNTMSDLMKMENLPSLCKEKKVVYFEMPYKKTLERTMLVPGLSIKDITLPNGNEIQGNMEEQTNQSILAMETLVKNESPTNISIIPASSIELKGVPSDHATITVVDSTSTTHLTDCCKSISNNIQTFHIQKTLCVHDNATNGEPTLHTNSTKENITTPIQLANPSISISANVSHSLEWSADPTCNTSQENGSIQCSSESISDPSTPKFEISSEEDSLNNVDEICLQVNCDDNSVPGPVESNFPIDTPPQISPKWPPEDPITHISSVVKGQFERSVAKGQFEKEMLPKTSQLVGEGKINGEKFFIRTDSVVIRRRVSKDGEPPKNSCDKTLATVPNGMNCAEPKDITGDVSRSPTTDSSKPSSPVANGNVRLVRKCSSSSKRQRCSDDGIAASCKRKKTTGDIFCCGYCGNYGIVVESLKSNGGTDFCSPNCLQEYNEEKRSKEDVNILDKCDENTLAKCDENTLAKCDENTLAKCDEKESESKICETSDLIPAVPFPWGDGIKSFCWDLYLKHVKIISADMIGAPVDLWSVPYPTQQSPLKTGTKLEVIDPYHQSLFCVATVHDTIGQRVRIHFDGYSALYDFWCNAESPLLFPMDWCTGHRKTVSCPPGMLNFSWDAYLEHCKLQRTAMATNFGPSHGPNNGMRFQVGMKLEAEDRKNCLICVATVIDVIGSRILVTFDGWEPTYDAWFDITSSFIHPIGWARRNDMDLCVPKDYKRPDCFNWTEYLVKTGSRPAPPSAFRVRAPKAFRVGMKVEAIDRRNPVLLRVATVSAVDGYRIKIHFDGWDDLYDYWIDDDCPDVHPPLWAQRTGHPLQPPLTQEQCAVDVDSGLGCGTPGCKGFGHAKGLVYDNHHTVHGCPYSMQNLGVDWAAYAVDRLASVPVTKVAARNAINLDRTVSPSGDDDMQGKRVRKRRRFFDEIGESARSKAVKIAAEECRNSRKSSPVAQLTKPVAKSPLREKVTPPRPPEGLSADSHQSVFRPHRSRIAISPIINAAELLSQKQPDFGLGKLCYKSIVELKPSDIKVLVERVGCDSHWSNKFVEHEIDGIAFVMLEQSDLTNILKITLGPSKKIMLCVEHIKLACQT